MGIFKQVHSFVREDRIKYVIEENMKIQRQFMPKKIEGEHKLMGSTTDVPPKGDQ